MAAAAAADVLRLREAAAREGLADLFDWLELGRDIINRLWDLVDAADSLKLVDLLRGLCDRETGLQSALSMLQRHVEATLGDRHGRTAIMDGDVAVAAVERTAASTKWAVDDAWPVIRQAIEKADRLPIGDPEDGELEDDTARALRIIRQLCGVSYLRVEACRELDIDPEDYRTKGNYRWTVKLP